MKIVLSSAPEKGLFKKGYLPNLGLAYVASSLEKAGNDVAMIDAHIEGYSALQLAEKILSYKPEAVGFTGTSHNRFNVVAVCDILKKEKKNLLTLAGGPHWALVGKSALEEIPSIDVIVKGEGEEAAAELIRAFGEKSGFSSIEGLIFRKANGDIVETPARKLIEDLDALPLPAWHLLDLSKYDANLEGIYETRAFGVLSSRGCPYDCVYCANAALGRRRLRLRKAKSVVDEIEFLMEKYGFGAFDFWDDTMTSVPKHVEEICREIIDRKLDIKWYALGRVNNITRETLELMRRAGCRAVAFGVESGSERILKAIRKKITLDEARCAVKWALELDLYVKLFFMVSLPGERPQDVEKTFDFYDEMRHLSDKVVANYAFTEIYPGTELEGLARASGQLGGDFSWNRPYELAKNRLYGFSPDIPMFENPDFPIEEVKAIVARRKGTKGALRRGWRRIKKIRNLDDVKSVIRMGARYLKKKSKV